MFNKSDYLIEDQDENRMLARAKDRSCILAPLLPYRVNGGLGASDLRRAGVIGRKVSIEEIHSEYHALCKNLDNRNQVLRTTAEIRVEKIMSEVCKFKPMISAWLGPYCVDIFFPQIKSGFYNNQSKYSIGLIIEIDGPIHHDELKMKKDSTRLNEFARRGIFFYGIPNDKLNGSEIRKLFRDLRISLLTDYRAKKRLLLRLYTWTLFSHLSDADIEVMFELQKGDLASLILLQKQLEEQQLGWTL